jgi:hypothetical protein
MDISLSRYHAIMNFDGRMEETREKSKEYDSTLSCKFGVVECLRGIFDQETMGQVGKLVPVEIPGK